MSVSVASTQGGYLRVYFRGDDFFSKQPVIAECSVFKGKFYCARNTLFSVLNTVGLYSVTVKLVVLSYWSLCVPY